MGENNGGTVRAVMVFKNMVREALEGIHGGTGTTVHVFDVSRNETDEAEYLYEVALGKSGPAETELGKEYSLDQVLDLPYAKVTESISVGGRKLAIGVVAIDFEQIDLFWVIISSIVVVALFLAIMLVVLWQVRSRHQSTVKLAQAMTQAHTKLTGYLCHEL